jgi:two-component system phosphate regulon sensor histidine kinase PhoR
VSNIEIRYSDNYYACNFTPVNNDLIVVIMHDISELKRIEKMKRDFVSNVSHELRTPLTAIKGFLETLEDRADEKSRSFLEIIKRNTERLINIVNDLLLLSELEERGVKPMVEEVNLRELLDKLSKLFQKQLQEKSLYLKINIKDEASVIMADPFQLEQLFINLVDNAIKYTEKGGVTIDISRDDGNIKIEIEDTGIGIPEEHLPRIFERFYVVDKSRSRRSGGTGLGLSIVKHIVLLHNGSISVKSKPQQGTRFTIILPEKPA